MLKAAKDVLQVRLLLLLCVFLLFSHVLSSDRPSSDSCTLAQAESSEDVPAEALALGSSEPSANGGIGC